ncbi:hypothetical protein [Frondihabitans cladoniiphilus]|uniref:Uncharacterized protein n=1 Tax=Frondihabitans cladoniiphilus TaxID=715785 RepID=A0ABP8VLE6_9MICO
MATTDDAELSRSLTAAVRAVEGVTGVFPSQPLLEAAADALAVRLDLREPDEMVDIDRSDRFTTVTAHISTSASLPAPETVRRVGELIRDTLLATGAKPDELAVNVSIRLVEDTGLRTLAPLVAGD